MDLKAIFAILWNMSLTGSLVILFVLAARFFLRKAPKIFSYALWAAVLFRLLCPVSISSALSVLHVAPAAEPVSQGTVTVMDYSALDIPMLFPEAEIQQQVPIDAEQRPVVIPKPEQDIQELPVQNNPEPVRKEPRSWMDYGVILWLAGLAVMVACNSCSCIRLLRQIEGAVPLRKDLYLADHIPTAFVLGVVRPRIYLPSYLSVEERGYIIAHERCHIRRKDHIFRLLAYLALCLHWFNPLVWLAFSLSGKDMEMSCDEAVLRMYGPRIRADYSTSLLRLATGHHSFSLTPLAFGEGDTKGRVINMSKWKKPKLWVSLLALPICLAIMVACTTNPRQKEEPVPMVTEPPTEAVSEEALWDEHTDLKQICADAIRKLLDADSYYLQYQTQVEMNGGGTYILEYRRHGDFELVKSPNNELYGSLLLYGNDYASFYGDFWVWNGARNGMSANETIQRWSPDFIVAENWRTEGNNIIIHGTWPHALISDTYYEGTVTYQFGTDGSLKGIYREYVQMRDGAAVSGSADQMMVMAEAAEDTLSVIKAIAVQCITEEELEQKRFERDTVSEIPSNKTMYDTDYELGAGQMGWEFFDNEIKFKYGAVSDDGSSATVTHYVTASEVKTVVAKDSFWLEEFVDGKWQYVDKNIIAVPIEKRNVETKGYEELSYEVDWSDSYGTLKAGFYRIGRYHTVELYTGEKETRPCYAKFRVFGRDWDVLLEKCREAVSEVYCRDSYHIVTYDNLTDHADPEDELGWGYLPYNIVTHTWQHDRDFLEDAQYIDRQDPKVLHGRRGSMRRNYVCYSLEWSGKETDSPVSFWSTNNFYTPHVEMDLDTTYLWIDSLVEDVVEKGNQISVVYTADGRSVRQEYVYTFDDAGLLKRIERIHHPVAGSDRIKETVVDSVLEVMDTPASEIQKRIASQDVSKPIPFTYAVDLAEYPDARKDGFVNTKVQTVQTMEDAIRLADKECTMPIMVPQDKTGYNITEVHYDAVAKIWKVVFRYSQNLSGDQAIYINDQGITQMVVTYTEENDPR